MPLRSGEEGQRAVALSWPQGWGTVGNKKVGGWAIPRGTGGWWSVLRGDSLLDGKWFWGAEDSFGERENELWDFCSLRVPRLIEQGTPGAKEWESKGESRDRAAREAGRGRPESRPRNAFSWNAFSATPTQPLSGPLLPRRQRREQLFPPSRGPRWKRHPWARRQAGRRQSSVWAGGDSRPTPRSQHQTSPLPPL